MITTLRHSLIIVQFAARILRKEQWFDSYFVHTFTMCLVLVCIVGGAIVNTLRGSHYSLLTDRWITERSATCPLCKADVTVPADEDEQPLEWTPPDDENAPTATPSARYWSDWFPNRTITTTTPQDLTSVRVV